MLFYKLKTDKSYINNGVKSMVLVNNELFTQPVYYLESL